MARTGFNGRGGNWAKLTDKQKVFTEAYLETRNAAEAARRAGYATPGVAGSKLLNHKVISAIIGKVNEENNKRSRITQERIIQELEWIALRDPADLCDEDGKIDTSRIDKLPERIRRAIDGIEITTFYDQEGNQIQKVKLKLVPKLGSIELLMKHRGMLSEKQQTGDSGKLQLPWDELFKKANEIDTIESRIEALDQKRLTLDVTPENKK